MSPHSVETINDLDLFKRKIIAHSHLKSAFNQVRELIQEPAGVEVAAVIGPTGVGKTTLRTRIEQEILKQNEGVMKEQPDCIPVISPVAPAPEIGSFNWRDTYLQMLEELNEPACDWQVTLKNGDPRQPGLSRLSSLNAVELRRRVESACRYRKVQVLLLDEAQHLRKIASGRCLLDQGDTLKMLAKNTGAFVVLFGTYSLIPLLSLSGQVARRFIWVHLPRYRFDEASEWRDFQTCVRSFEAEIHLPKPSHLVGMAKMLYRGSAGCIGILKNWLTKAYREARRCGAESLTHEILQATCLPTSSLRTIADEIARGEREWAKSHGIDPELDSLLGISDCNASERTTEVAQLAKRRTPCVGMRNPKRDPIVAEAAV